MKAMKAILVSVSNFISPVLKFLLKCGSFVVWILQEPPKRKRVPANPAGLSIPRNAAAANLPLLERLGQQANPPILKRLGQQANPPILERLGQQANPPILERLGQQANPPILERLGQQANPPILERRGHPTNPPALRVNPGPRATGAACPPGTAAASSGQQSSTTNERKEPYKLVCAICCREPHEISRQQMSTVCGHVFCTPCFRLARKHSKKCPTCNKHLSKRDFHQMYIRYG